jgi:alpha-tubulin suppressor-like RCC1 family protein
VGTSGIHQAIVPHPAAVLTERRFTSLSAGFGFTCGVTTDQSVMCWGSNVDYILGPSAPDRCGDVGSAPCSTLPLDINIPERVVQVSAGTSHACVLSETANVYCWGANISGQVGVVGHSSVSLPEKLDLRLEDRVVTLSSGGIQTCAVTSTQLGYCWGADAISFGQRATRAQVEPILTARGKKLRRISLGPAYACAISATEQLLCWGDTIFGALGVR